MSCSGTSAEAKRAAIILAGGDGSRLLGLTRFIAGGNAPKQFCAVTGESTLLDQTRHRAAKLIPVDRTAIVVNRAHRCYYRSLIGDVPRQCIVEQAANRGTAPAILYGLLRLAQVGSDATVVIFPSDHFIGNEDQFLFHVREAMQAVEESPSRTVVLGMAPRSAETAYGWIEPSLPVSSTRPDLFRVRRFWEKPRIELAIRLRREGCLWNSFVVVGSARRLLEIIADSIPRTFLLFQATIASRGECSNRAIDKLYGELPSSGFSEEVLSRCPSDLMVARVEDVEWNDLGEPDRVLQTLRTIGRKPNWMESYRRSIGLASV